VAEYDPRPETTQRGGLAVISRTKDVCVDADRRGRRAARSARHCRAQCFGRAPASLGTRCQAKISTPRSMSICAHPLALIAAARRHLAARRWGTACLLIGSIQSFPSRTRCWPSYAALKAGNVNLAKNLAKTACKRRHHHQCAVGPARLPPIRNAGVLADPALPRTGRGTNSNGTDWRTR